MTIIDGTGHYHVVQCVNGEGPDTALESFTITGGNAESGGGMYIAGSSPTVTNCILWSNSAPTGPQIYGDATVRYSNVRGGGWAGTDNINANPLFAGVYGRLSCNSPCIDAGNNTAVPAGITTDLDGSPRFADFSGRDDTGSGTPPIVDGGEIVLAPGASKLVASVDIDPDTLNLKSKGKWITCYIELPAGSDVGEIDVSTILLNGQVPVEPHPTEVGDYDGDGIADLMVKFELSATQDIVEVADAVQIPVAGKLNDGTEFEGCDLIRVKRGD